MSFHTSMKHTKNMLGRRMLVTKQFWWPLTFTKWREMKSYYLLLNAT